MFMLLNVNQWTTFQFSPSGRSSDPGGDAVAERESVVTDAMRAQIGVESQPWEVEVFKTDVRMFARAVGHTDPAFYDEAEAQRRGFRSLPVPPGYLGTSVFMPEQPGHGAPQLAIPYKRRLNGGTEVECTEQICVGDLLWATSQIAELQETTGSIGPMLIVTTETVYKRDGTTVAKLRGTGIRY